MWLKQAVGFLLRSDWMLARCSERLQRIRVLLRAANCPVSEGKWSSWCVFQDVMKPENEDRRIFSELLFSLSPSGLTWTWSLHRTCRNLRDTESFCHGELMWRRFTRHAWSDLTWRQGGWASRASGGFRWTWIFKLSANAPHVLLPHGRLCRAFSFSKNIFYCSVIKMLYWHFLLHFLKLALVSEVWHYK